MQDEVFIKHCHDGPRALLLQPENGADMELYYIDRTVPAMPELKYVCMLNCHGEVPVNFSPVTDPLDKKFWLETVKRHT